MATTPSVTTAFRPDPTCFAASNLWLERDRGGCNTYYTPFSPRPTEVVTIPECRYVRLGPFFGDYDNMCLQNNWVRTGSVIAMSTAYSACPEGWTGVHTSTRTWSAITVEETACCPPAYDFTTANLDPTTYPTVIDGTTYPMTYPTMHSYCKAASVSQLSGSKVTLTVAASPSPTTTEVDWDYANDFIVAPVAKIEKYLYTGRPGTTSTCFGSNHCVMNSNPIKPHPTYARHGTYFPPPVTAVAQFTPAPSCLASSALWLVSDKCSLAIRGPATPPWLECTHTVAGDPDPTRADCYPVGGRTVATGTPTYYTGCPAGYTAANSTQYFPWTAAGRGPAYSGVEATRLTCCPSAFGDVAFTHASPKWTYTTVHDGATHTVSSYTLPPWCAASGTAVAASQLGGEALTLGLYSNGYQGKPGKTYDGQSEAVWEEGNTLYAHPQTVSWTVFHGTHTCFEASDCAEYFTYSYGNTMGPGVVVATPTPTRDSEGDGGGSGGEAASSSSTGAAAALVPVRGDGRAGLGMVVVVVTVVVNVVLGAGLS